jgi:FAD/FMN-containing dehydrogenase
MSTETFIGNRRGPVVRRMDADYDAVRSLYNGMIDKSPRMIARCTDVADVVASVNFARQNDLQVAIRGGGHNGPGLGSVDNGMMIDMSMMKGVRVNPTACTVRAGPGCTQGDVDHATHIYGLAVPAGKSDTAWNTRNATWSMVIAGIDPNPQKAGEITRWTKGYWEAVHSYSADGGYVNFMMDDGDDSRLKATYGDNYDRLVALKGKYDPTNFFRVNQNIGPLHS